MIDWFIYLFILNIRGVGASIDNIGQNWGLGYTMYLQVLFSKKLDRFLGLDNVNILNPFWDMKLYILLILGRPISWHGMNNVFFPDLKAAFQ